MLVLFVRFKKLSYLCNVIQLGRHIEILLLDNDCVIVPDFGGFVAHHVSACYDADDQTWLPPMRTLGFNPQLRINDSLLVQSYINAYDISYPESLRRIEDEVNELKQLLDQEGCYELEDIGTLRVNDEGIICFEPSQAGILSPTLYALPLCSFPMLKPASGLGSQRSQANKNNQNVLSSQTNQSSQNTLDNPDNQNEQTVGDTDSDNKPTLLDFIDDDDDINTERAITIKMSWIRNAIAIAAAVVAFFFMATPIANSDLGSQTMSNLKGNVLYKLIPQDSNVATATPVQQENAEKSDISEASESTDSPVSEERAETSEEAESSEKAKDSESTEQSTSSETFTIVLASQVKRSNAEYYVEQLKKRGYGDAKLYVHNNLVRVVYGSFATEADAYAQLRKMNDKEEFSEAWVYSIKN